MKLCGRVCTKCHIEKDVDQFPVVYGKKRKDGSRKRGICAQCKACRRAICKRWFGANPGYAAKKKQEWDAANRDYIKQYDKAYNLRNLERVKKWKKEWDAKNYDWVLEYKRQRYNTDPNYKEKVRKWQLGTGRKMREELKDCYVIYCLSRRVGGNAETLRQYPDLIEAQRLLIKTHRLCKTLQNSERA